MKRFEALPVLQRLPPCLKWHHRSKTQLHKICGNVGIPVLWRLQRKERLVWNEEEEAPSLVWRESQDPQQHYPQVRWQFPRDETRSQKTQIKTNTCTKRNAKTLTNITPIRGRSNMATPPLLGPGYNPDWLQDAGQKTEESIATFYIWIQQNLKYLVKNILEAPEQVWAKPRSRNIWEMSHNQICCLF